MKIKKKILLFILIACLFLLTGIGPVIFNSHNRLSESACSTPSQGANFTEGFEGVGYENSWTEPTGTVNEDYTGLAYNCSESAYVDSADSADYAMHDHGSSLDIDTTSMDYVFYFRIITIPGDGDALAWASAGSTTNPTDTTKTFSLNINNSSGTVTVRADGQSSSSSTETVVANTWYKMTVHLDTTPASSYMQIDSGSQRTFTRFSNDPRYFFLGALNTGAGESIEIAYDLFSY